MSTTYLIRAADGNAGDNGERLVRAPNKVAAMRHFTRDMFTIEPASIDDVHRLSRDGVDIEDVKGDAA